MATKFTFPKSPKIGDRIEIVGVSAGKLPINIVGNSEAGKNITIYFGDQIYTGVADGNTVITTITDANIVYGFRCVSVKNTHTWVVEDTALYSKLKALEARIAALES